MPKKRKAPEPKPVWSIPQEFAEYYEEIVKSMATSWCFYADEPQIWAEKEVSTRGSFRVIRQPTKAMMEGEEYTFCLIIQVMQGSKVQKLTEAQFDECMAAVSASGVEERLCKSYDKMLKVTNGRWYCPCDGSFEKISGIEYMTYQDGSIRVKCHLRYEAQDHEDWYPFYLCQPDDYCNDKEKFPWKADGSLDHDQVDWKCVQGIDVPDAFYRCTYPAEFSEYYIEDETE